MVSIEWVILCKNAHEDADGLLCIDGIINTFTVPEVPTFGEGNIVFRLRGKPNQEVTLRIDLREPIGTWLAKIPLATITIDETGLSVHSVAGSAAVCTTRALRIACLRQRADARTAVHGGAVESGGGALALARKRPSRRVRAPVDKC